MPGYVHATAFLIDRKGAVRYTHEGYSLETLETFRREVATLPRE